MIRFSSVHFSYDGEHPVLQDVDLTVAPGEFVCILGGNGSGKSTLAKHCNALLEPDEGTVLVRGLDTANEENVYAIRSSAGMVFQNPDDQIVASLVEDDVAFGPENMGVETAEIIERVTDALREVGLAGFAKHETHALSGGQKQRVAIAGALAMRPQILILDEASSMLDPRGRKGLMRLCKELNARGMAIVMITHFMEEAAEADRVVVLNEGRVALQGSPEEVLTQADQLMGLNLEVPFACEFSLELRKRGIDVPVSVHEDEVTRGLAQLTEVSRGNGGVDGENNASRGAGDTSCSSANKTHGGADGTPRAVPARAESASGAFVRAGLFEHGAPSAPHPIIAFENVSYSYLDSARKRKNRKKAAQGGERADWGTDPNAVWALRDITFSVQRGEFLGIAGHTGSGKSTLIQHMNGLVNPSEGRVLVDGRDVADKKAAAAAREKVGVVFQYPEHQLFAASVYEDVAFGPRNLGFDQDEVDARVREALSLVDLDFEAICECSPFELSGGQQRRVAFAGVLAMRPEVLVLDEPVAGLDPAARRDFLALVRKLHARGLTVVMVSHNMDDLADLADRILVLKEGGMFAIGAPDQVFLDEDALSDIGLGVPAPQRMANRLRAAGLPLADGILYDGAMLADAVTAAVTAVARANGGDTEGVDAPTSAANPAAARPIKDEPQPNGELTSEAMPEAAPNPARAAAPATAPQPEDA